MNTIIKQKQDAAERAPVEAGVIKPGTVVKLGLDVHARQITVCRHNEGSVPKPPQSCNWPGLLQLVGELVKAGAKVYTCHEAGPVRLRAAPQAHGAGVGVTNYVVSPQNCDERGRRVKNDRRDSGQMCSRLDRYVAGNREVFSVVRVPSEQEERERA